MANYPENKNSDQRAAEISKLQVQIGNLTKRLRAKEEECIALDRRLREVKARHADMVEKNCD